MQNGLLQFEKAVKVRQQVVAGTMYYFTNEAKDGKPRSSMKLRFGRSHGRTLRSCGNSSLLKIVPALKVDLFMFTWWQISSISFSKVSYLLLC
jgi:hypothetical protein